MWRLAEAKFYCGNCGEKLGWLNHFGEMQTMASRDAYQLVELKSPGPRLLSLDALRGFDMFWIMGGEGDRAKLPRLSLRGRRWFGLRGNSSIRNGMGSRCTT